MLFYLLSSFLSRGGSEVSSSGYMCAVIEHELVFVNMIIRKVTLGQKQPIVGFDWCPNGFLAMGTG